MIIFPLQRQARENKELNQDAAEVSMVVLNQMSSVIDKYTKNKCLFSRDLLGLSVADINEQLVAKSLRDESDRRLWRRLVKHWTILCRSNKISASELARLFGPKLIGYSNTTASEKAVKFVEKIINDAAVSLDGSGGGGGGQFTESKTERSLTETSINQELMMASSSKLKESSFYQDFIQSTHSSGKLAKPAAKHDDSDEDDDDDDDDDVNEAINALVAPKSTLSSGNQTIKSRQGGAQLIKSPRGKRIFKI